MKASAFRFLEKARVTLLILSLIFPALGMSHAASTSAGTTEDPGTSLPQDDSSSNSKSKRSKRSSTGSSNSKNSNNSDSSSNSNSSSGKKSSSRSKSSSRDKNSKDKDKTKEKEGDKDASKTKGTGKPGETGKQPEKPKSQTLTGKAPGASQKSSKGGAEGFSATMAEGFGAAAAENIAILYLYPMDISTDTNQDFEVTIRMENLTSNKIDGFRFTLVYSAPWLEFLGYDSGPFEVFAQHPDAALQVDRSKEGEMTFSGRFDTPAAQRKADLLTLRFRSREVTGNTKLKFLLPPKGEAPALSSGGENVLGRPEQSFYGVVDCVVTIKRPAEVASDQKTTETQPLDLATAMPNEMPKQAAIIEGWIGQTPLTKADAPVRLQIQAPENTTLAAGEDFWVDLVLLNDEQASFESLSATVRFDPNTLTVLDEDEDNWTQLGVNIWDGAFHDSYPFDFMRYNEAENQRGVIRYSVARNAGSWPFPTGVFARIHFQAKESALPGTTAIRLERTLGGYPATYIHSMGVDRLEKTWDTTQPPTIALKILAAPPIAKIDPNTQGTAASTSQTAQVAPVPADLKPAVAGLEK
jgi:hypothetical protein